MGHIFLEMILQLIHNIASAPITYIWNNICSCLAFYEDYKNFCLITFWSQDIPLGRLQNTFIWGPRQGGTSPLSREKIQTHPVSREQFRAYPVSRGEFQYYLVSIEIFLENEYKLLCYCGHCLFTNDHKVCRDYRQHSLRLSLQISQVHSNASKPTYNYIAIGDGAREKFRGCTKENANLENTLCNATSML